MTLLEILPMGKECSLYIAMNTNKRRKIMILYILYLAAALCTACHNESDKPRIESIEFSEKTVQLKTGENKSIGIKVLPEGAKNAEKVTFTASGSGIVEINEEMSSNDGVVFSAVRNGSAVITAKAQGVVDYVQVTVEGNAETGIPYITVTDSVLEIQPGIKKHFMSTLQNGAPDDYLSFVFSNQGQDIIQFEMANNTVVVEGIKKGSDIITVKHPKAQYGVDVLVFVLEAGEYAKYITGENTLFMESGKNKIYHSRLIGIEESETGYNVYQVVEGNDIITVSGSGENCSITAKREGVAKVRITNRSAPYPFEFTVVVRGEEKSGYIAMSSNFVILENGDIRTIFAYYNGDAPGDIDTRYTWYFENNVTDVAEVICYGDRFALRALKNGSVKLIIENEYSLVRQEVLILVHFDEVSYGEMLITTSQNVIYMELGGVDVILKMKLVGGTQADKNSFEWVVEDSSIIEAAVPDGHGTAHHRAMIYNDTVQEAEAKITAKKAGTTYITVTNSKASKNAVRVLVKVYPKGMFSGNVVSLGGSGLLKVQKGSLLDVNVQLTQGSYQNTGELVWHIKDGKIAEINGAGLSGVINALESGITELIVTGQNVLNEYHAVVVVYEEGDEDSIPYIYTDRLQYKLYVGQMVYVYICHPNIENEVFDFSIVNTDTSVVYTRKQSDVIILHAVEPGEAELVINSGIPGCNIITLTVNVELAELNTDKPYTIMGNSSAVTYVGGAVEYQATMAGSSETDKSKMTWTIDDPSIASLEMVNGTNVVLRGHRTGQTVLRAQSAKSANVKEVIVFVTATQDDAYTKIILGLAKINYVVKEGESFFVKLITNASEPQKLQIRWAKSDADILDVDDNYDTAFITAIVEGTCIITVDTRNSSHIMPLLLYVTVRSPVFEEMQFGFPSSVVLVKGQSKIIKGNMIGGGMMSDFIWNLEDDNVVHVIGNGIEATLWGRGAGQTFLTVSYYGFSKKILIICVENENDLENVWYFTADKTYLRIKKNEEARVNLLFGENGFPEDEKTNIRWVPDLNNNIISLSYSGPNAKIIGKNSGVARVIVSHEKVGKDIELLVEVVDTVTGSDEYYMLFPAINKMVVGVPQTIPVSLYKGGHLYTQGYNLITVKTEGKGIVDAESPLLNDTLRILGRKGGREYITLSHPVAGERRMLVVVYEGQIPANDNPVIFVDKQYWSVYEGQETVIDLQISGGDEFTESSIRWVNNDPKIITLDSTLRTKAKVTGLSFGSTAMDVLLDGDVVEKVYVSVAKGNIKADVVVSTESIIVMALDTDVQHKTKAIGGANATEFNWAIGNENIATINSYENECTLYPENVGTTELTVGGYNYERKIIVVVVPGEKEKMEANYLNIDKRYYRLKRGESTVIYPYYKTIKPSVQADLPLPRYNSGVIAVERYEEGFVITGKNEGIELLTIKNGRCENNIQIAVEVINEIAAGVSENARLVYMTTEDNIIKALPGVYGNLIKINVIGEYAGTNNDFIWSRDSNLVEWETYGTYAFFHTKNGTGEVNITIENSFCQYSLSIKIVIEDNFVEKGTPFVYSDRTVYRFSLNDSALRVNFQVKNLETVDYNNVRFLKTGNAVDAVLNGSCFEVRPKTQGVSEIEIWYPDALPLKLYFIVSDSVENAAVYLTTTMNYVVVQRSKTKVVDVLLMNYTELNADNITWHSSDDKVVTVVGTGRTVQVHGVETGFAKLTVKHGASYNDLEILVKVVEENDLSGVTYLTTGDNIIETYVQNNSLQVTVNKVGGMVPELETVWSVDNPAVAQVQGSGSTAYIVPKKAGIAKIRVTEKEAGNLDIVVIVKEAKEGTEYITTNQSVIQINPGTLNHTIQVNLVGGSDLDSQQFEWSVYNQLPSDYEVAKNGGTVISLFGMGDRATISGNYVGTARVRVDHPKAQLPLYITVQVTNFIAMSFNEDRAVIISGEIYFAGICVPNYRNFAGKVEYSTDNPEVCVVTGSDKVALLQSKGVGKANITAIVRGTDLRASIEVTVTERDNFAEPNIIIPKTTYLLNPRERPFTIEAYLQGVGVTEEMRYGIQWEASLYNGSSQETILDAIEMYPREKEPAGTKPTVLKGQGSAIQIEVLNPKLADGQTFQTKEIVIVVSQPEITSRIKTIYIKIAEVSGIFTISRSEITMETGNSADLSCNILGASSADYKEVVWIAETSPTGKEIARVLPATGKDVHIHAMNDGTIFITAIYRNEIAECRVQIKSSIYLSLEYETFFTYPGARSKSQGLVEVEFEVRPYTTQVMWTPRGPTPDSANPVAIIDVVSQDYSTGKGKITIEPMSEGSFVITGTMSGRYVQMTVIIKNVYRFKILNQYLDMQPGVTTTYSPGPKEGRYWDYDCNYNPVYNDGKIGADVYIPIIICPPDHRVDFSSASQKIMRDYGITYEISPIIEINNLEGRGIIRLMTTREIPKIDFGDRGMILELDLKKPFGDGPSAIIGPEMYSSNSAATNNKIWLTSRLPVHQTALIPVFQRVYGKYSNQDYASRKYKYYDGSSGGNNYRNKTTLTNINPSSSTAFDVNASQWQTYPTGVMPEFNKAAYAESTSEYLKKTQDYSFSKNGHSVRYELEIGDGEEHYIIFDKTHAGMYFDDITINDNDFNTKFQQKEFYKDKATRAPTAKLKDLDNGDKAILINGGKDFIVYDQVKVKHRNKFTFMYFSASNASKDRVYTMAIPHVSNFTGNTMTISRSHIWGGNRYQTFFLCRDSVTNNELPGLFFVYDDVKMDTQGDIFNYLDGKMYNKDFKGTEYYQMFMNSDSKFKSDARFKNLTDNQTRNYFPPYKKVFSEVPSYCFLQYINSRAVREAVNHNINKRNDNQTFKNYINGTLSLQQLYFSDGQPAGISPTTEANIIFTALSNQHGSIMSDYDETKNTLYVKRDIEENYNRIHSLSSFDNWNPISIYPTKSNDSKDPMKDKKVIFEDITNNNNYAPAASYNSKEIYQGDNSYTLIITYKNSYHDTNRIYINVKHKIRSDNIIPYSEETLTWDQAEMVQEFSGLNSSNVSNLYGYFFVDKNY
jgi:hypothetical protein